MLSHLTPTHVVPTRRIAVAVVFAALLVGTAGVSTAGAASDLGAFAARAPTARLAWTAQILTVVTVRSRPGAGRSIQRIDVSSPTFGGANVLLVLGTAVVRGREYVEVLLKRREARTTGWIPADAARLARTRKRIVVDLSRRTLELQSGGRTLFRTRAVVGSANTRTPTGLLAVDAVVAQPSGSSLGPLVVAITSFPDWAHHFVGQRLQSAIHSSERLGAPLGSAASEGCVRIPTRLVREIADRVPRGAPVLVRR